ncbi:MAG: OmpA family protein [Patescibacteria group bacterium]
MKAKVLSLPVVLLATLGWFAASAYWYTCNTQDICGDASETSSESVANEADQANTVEQPGLTVADEPEPTEPVYDEALTATAYFNPDAATFTSFEWQLDLNEMVRTGLEGDASYTITGYTAGGSGENARRLSLERANALLDYMVESGVNADDVTIAIKAGEDAVADNADEAGRVQNRRAVVTFNKIEE